ncbi:MAG: FtsQ-type POTRA domain-containing protein [Candidatus Cloacimonetes bacterium]|nr:FtsQ-type POTRA domain-containing protein [Candidatus Cloacimonadota bacterium]
MKKRRGNTRYFAWFISIIIASYIIFRLIMLLFYSLNIFMIKELDFSGNKALLADNLRMAGASLIGQNMFRVTSSEVKELYSAFSRIKDLSVKRRLPGKLKIKIVERQPVFQILTQDGEILVVDIEQILLSFTEAAISDDITIISVQASSDTLQEGKKINDPFLEQMISLFPAIQEAEPDFFDYISEIYLDGQDLYMVENKQGYKIILPQENLLQSIIDYMDIKNTYSFDNKTIIDMTIENNYRVIKREE